jgi:hypothetical protein
MALTIPSHFSGMVASALNKQGRPEIKTMNSEAHSGWARKNKI